MTEGRILSIESMGLVDGPGIRTVIFFQGCALRCQFCHNPDSWATTGGETVSVDGLMKKIVRFRPYFERSGGGVTFSGGEPLLQKEFLLALLKECKREGVHTCLDTAGVGVGGYEEILSLCDLVLYDVKAVNQDAYRKICGASITETEKFQAALAKTGTPTIVRHVVMPTVNDSEEDMLALKAYVKERIPTATKIELLPYHLMGAHKYDKLGLPRPIPEIKAMDRDKTQRLWETYFKNLT